MEQQIHIAISEAQYRSEQERMNYRITEFYIEHGITGTHGNRPEFIRLQQNISLKQHGFVIFKEISRLVRDLEIWKRFFRLCQQYDCEICIRGLPFNPNDPASILQLDQLAAFAEFESRTTSKRIRESNHSAMLTSGKFNTHYPLLGLDAVKNERGEHTGTYKLNKAELKQVEWIMSSFLRVDRYKVLLDLCKARGIKSKRGQDFNKNNIRALLANPRYIGKWYRNKHNKDKRQNKLMPYERYTEVDLDHGCIIDKELWQRVQAKVKELDESRAKATRHCYPLSGLLVFDDGSSFVGNGAWGNTCKSTYYYNKSNKIRVRTEVFEAEAQKILRQVADNAPEFQKSLADYAAHKDSSIDVATGKIAEIDRRLEELAEERQRLDRRLNFLLEDDDLEMARSFRQEYKEQVSALKNEAWELADRRRQLQLLQKQLAETRDASKTGWLEQVNTALGFLKKNDLVSLRSAYRQIFDKIVVRRLDEAKVRLQFFFRNLSTAIYNGEVANCTTNGLVDEEHRGTESVFTSLLSIRSGIYDTSPLISEIVIRQKYLENHLSTRDIASKFSCSKTYVRSLLMRYNIPLRKASECRRSRWFSYGKRWVNGKTTDHQGEQRTIAAIKKMHAEGMSASAIARLLDTMKIPTKQQGKGWRYDMVITILKREGSMWRGTG